MTPKSNFFSDHGRGNQCFPWSDGVLPIVKMLEIVSNSPRSPAVSGMKDSFQGLLDAGTHDSRCLVVIPCCASRGIQGLGWGGRYAASQSLIQCPYASPLYRAASVCSNPVQQPTPPCRCSISIPHIERRHAQPETELQRFDVAVQVAQAPSSTWRPN